MLIKGSLIVKPYGITNVPLSYDAPTDNATNDKTPLRTQEHPAADGRRIILQQERARKLVNLSKIPVLLETGEASYHAGWPGLGCVSKNVSLGRLESQMNQYQRIKVSWRLLRWGNGAAKWSA